MLVSALLDMTSCLNHSLGSTDAAHTIVSLMEESGSTGLTLCEPTEVKTRSGT
jgi:hypothetical protein